MSQDLTFICNYACYVQTIGWWYLALRLPLPCSQIVRPTPLLISTLLWALQTHAVVLVSVHWFELIVGCVGRKTIFCYLLSYVFASWDTENGGMEGRLDVYIWQKEHKVCKVQHSKVRQCQTEFLRASLILPPGEYALWYSFNYKVAYYYFSPGHLLQQGTGWMVLT